MTPLAGDGDLGVRSSIADIEALGSSASLEDAWKLSQIPESNTSAILYGR